MTFLKTSGILQLNDVNLWPPFSVTVTPLNNTQPCNINAAHGPHDGFATGMLPFYYIPTHHQRTMQAQYTDPSLTPSRFQGNSFELFKNKFL